MGNVLAGFSIQNWRALAPGLDGLDDPHLLTAEHATDVTFLPAISRRRISTLSRLCLRLAYEVAADYQGYCVFGSQHGELVTTQRLLESIVSGEQVSPAGFSASVHNTAVGLHSIHNHNTWPCTSLAAGLDTLASCFIEASAILEQTGSAQVLVVVADDPVPEPLDSFVSGNRQRGFAALITAAQTSCHIQLGAGSPGDPSVSDNISEPLSQLAAFLVKGQPGSCVLPGEMSEWYWQYNVN